MRVKFGITIYLCKSVTYSKGSSSLLFTDTNRIYVVDAGSEAKAEELYNQAFALGYCDVSDCEYSN